LIAARFRFAACVLVACGGQITSPGDDASVKDGAKDDGATKNDGGGSTTLAACAHACVQATNGDCPTLLLYDCLYPCGANASTEICEEGNGMPASLTTIECAKSTFPTCPATSCQSSTTCQAFVQCIDACH